MHRSDDPLIEAEHSRYMHTHLPNSQYIEFSGRDHLPWFGDTAGILSAIQTFLEGEKAKPDMLTDGLKPPDITTLHHLKQYLQKSYADEITLPSLARQFGLNEFKLKKGFRKLFGTSVIAFLSDIRFQKACELLTYSNDSVAEIAKKVGYTPFQ